MPFDLSVQDNNLLNSAYSRLQKFLLRDVRSSKGRNTPTGKFDIPQIRSQARALQYDLIQINGPKLTRYIAYDIDSKRAGMAWIDAGLPRPTFIMINPRNEHAHYIYELTVQCHTDPADPKYSLKQMRYLRAITTAHKQAMIAAGHKVDLAYQGRLVKNPWYAGWTVIAYDKAYTFQELHGSLELPWSGNNTTTKDTEVAPEGRNTTLFNRLRFWAYRNVRFYQDKNHFNTALTSQAQLFIQDFDMHGFAMREVDTAVFQVWRYVWNRYLNGWYHTDDYRYKSKVMHLPDDMDLAERELCGQQYTCDQRNRKTRDKILSAMQQLQSDGQPVNQSAVSRLTNLDRKTVRSHWKHVSSTEPVTQSLTASNGKVTVETECLRHESSLGGYAAWGWDDTIDPQLPTPPPAPKPVYYTTGTLTYRVLPTVDNWRKQRDFDEQPTTQ